MSSTYRKCDQYRCGLVVDLSGIKKNLMSLKALAPGKQVCSVVKADAYGLGSVAVSQMLEDITDVFAVATVDEGLRLRIKAHIKKPILILGPVFGCSDDVVIANELTQTVFDLNRARELNEYVKGLDSNKVKAHVHIAVDTGMSRIGVKADEDGASLVDKICELPNISVDGIFTHFATADFADKSLVNEALNKFLKFKKICLKKGIKIPIWHSANSASIIDDISLKDGTDMIRAGISMYGIYPSDEVHKEKITLYPVANWYAFITRVANIEKGTGISYGYTFIADQDMTIATVSCGYADGYSRLFSNRAEVLVHGKRCRIVGRVCMDQFMIDVSRIPQAKAGDRVILMGSEQDETITPDELAQISGTIAYEVISNISPRVVRIYRE